MKPDTAVGIMLEFARTHPGFVPAGTFYVNREPFGGVPESEGAHALAREERLRARQPHARPHPAERPERRGRAEQLATGEEVIHDVLPDYDVETMALPLGAMPRNGTSRRAGQLEGQALRAVPRGAARRRQPHGVAVLPGVRPARGATDPQLPCRLERRAGLRLQLLDAGAGAESGRALRLGRRPEGRSAFGLDPRRICDPLFARGCASSDSPTRVRFRR